MSRMLAGAIGDGAFKVVLGAAFAVGSAWLGDVFGVPARLMVVSGAALLIGGGIEVVFVRRRPMATCLRLMITYDIGWMVASALALVVAWQGGTAGGELWIAYLTAAPLLMAALLVRTPTASPGPEAPAPPGPDAPAAPAATSVRPPVRDTPVATSVRPPVRDTPAA
ncbi:hypothetical protein [Streptomyces cyaneofuscatus]|uniref:hypothetical protein n=1 Tax=Streptomyces cyaneofuscatus TaxID=66883 RepID=UPI00365301AF